MNIYLAPMEGITGYLFRNAFFSCFGDVDKYFTPFIATHTKKDMNSREKNDILPEHNEGKKVVPQMISKEAEDSIRLICALHDEYGYEEVNLNLGCPSGTVVAKGRGAGFLAHPKELQEYLDKVYNAITPAGIRMSIKTRIGIEKPEEFNELLEIYNQFPVSELIIHPRVQKDFYKNTPNLAVFEMALQKSKCPVIYNGDIFQKEDEKSRYGDIMLGRGLISNPALARELKGGSPLEKEELEKFHAVLYRGYREDFGGDTNALFKLKELWFYWGKQFAEPEKHLKKIKKARDFIDYEIAVKQFFGELELKKMETLVYREK
ncbi:MAG: tRNA dihydrouridine synthase [Roseburia sp.]